jgi:hypothetical protein
VIASWLHEKTLGHPYFLAFICRQLSVGASPLQPQRLEQIWPTIFDQLGVRNSARMSRSSAGRKSNSYANSPNLKKANSPFISSPQNSKQNISPAWLRRVCSSVRDEGDTSSTTRCSAHSCGKQNEPDRQSEQRAIPENGSGGPQARHQRTHRTDSVPLSIRSIDLFHSRCVSFPNPRHTEINRRAIGPKRRANGRRSQGRIGRVRCGSERSPPSQRGGQTARRPPRESIVHSC